MIVATSEIKGEKNIVLRGNLNYENLKHDLLPWERMIWGLELALPLESPHVNLQHRTINEFYHVV